MMFQHVKPSIDGLKQKHPKYARTISEFLFYVFGVGKNMNFSFPRHVTTDIMKAIDTIDADGHMSDRYRERILDFLEPTNRIWCARGGWSDIHNSLNLVRSGSTFVHCYSEDDRSAISVSLKGEMNRFNPAPLVMYLVRSTQSHTITWEAHFESRDARVSAILSYE